MSLIAIERLSHAFSNGQTSLTDVDLAVPHGQFVVICGANGSGKTTLLRHLNGLILPQKGRVLIDGKPVQTHLKWVRQMVGMVFQEPDNQIVGATVAEDVAFGPENLGLTHVEIQRRVTDCLTAVGLSHCGHLPPQALSGGSRRRLAIAGVLAMQPQIIAFDEPFSNLDYPGVRQVLEQMCALHRSGHTLMVATHDIEKVIAHAQRLIVLDQGRIACDGPPEAIMHAVERHHVRRPCAHRLGQPVSSWLS
jgi:biotin transport system ATP-binding protein